jgi:hypothetical protein
MKKFLALAFLGFITVSIISSCGGSNTHHCDAYGSIDSVEQNNDLASK